MQTTIPGTDRWKRLLLREPVLKEMIGEVSRLSGRSFNEVEDTLGIGHISMVDLDGCEQAIKRLQPELEWLRLNNPERISGTNWRRLAYGEPGNTIPELAACYVVFGDGRLLYVGSTENLADRIRGHGLKLAHYSNAIKTPWGTFLRVEIAYRPTIKYGDWAMVELRLIRRLQPAGNTRGIKKVKGVGA